ncbi:MAG: rod shape-determining protein MreC [Defluviitaleaceae bacterium]|nr:rod shape-determining protein MreC [Defluviitaleaceae bacterium]
MILCIISIVVTAGFRTPEILSTSFGFVIIPAQNVLNNISNVFNNALHHFRNTNYLIRENERMERELEELRFLVTRLELLEENNIDLNELLEMRARYPLYDMIGASIISRDNNNWNSRFNINAGNSNGVSQNMVVVARGALVGRVSFSGHNYSIVTPIIDDTSVVGAVSSRSGTVGFIRGDLTLGSNGLVIFETELNADIIEGDIIRTSAFGSIFPPGILIGTVTDTINIVDQNIIAIVEPIVDFNNLNNVLIIKSVDLD